MPLDGTGGREDVHSGTLCQDQTCCDSGQAGTAGSGEAIRRLPEHDSEDASVFGPAFLPAARAAKLEEVWALHRFDCLRF